MLPHPRASALLDAHDSLLIVVDVQDVFLDKLPRPASDQLLSNVCWLVQLAQWSQVPFVVTAEELPRQPLAAQLLQTLPADAPIFNKLIFGLADQADILAAVQRTGRKTAVLVGLETDVCITHSALGLLERGYRVAVVADATGTPEPGHALGLNRLQSAGVIIVTLKGLFYEWLRSVGNITRFHQERPHLRGWPGIHL